MRTAYYNDCLRLRHMVSGLVSHLEEAWGSARAENMREFDLETSDLLPLPFGGVTSSLLFF